MISMISERLSKGAKRYHFPLIFSIVGSSILIFTTITLLNTVFQQLLWDPLALVAVLSDPMVTQSILLTMYTSFLSTVISIIFGTPLAYVLARYQFPGKHVVESLVDVPVVVPHTVAGIALYALLMSRGAIGTAFANLGIVFEDSMWGVVAAMLFVSTPFYIDAAREGFESVNPHLERVARTLGASQWETFYKISLPLAVRHLFSGAVMSWARGISEFGAVVMIAFYPMIAPVLIFYRFNTHGLPGSRPISVLLLIVCFAAFMALRVITRYWRKYSDSS